ncbi:MAG: hypothetical protein KTR35_06250 [Gammaproteobacteria bacterium]|nr:hypothetical protein [Gammaproteobacteria bacterium]
MNTENTETNEIEKALNNVLSNGKFLASPQMSAFLSYVVKETIAGNAARIKAYTVAVDALGKPPTFDPQNDPSVRVLANRLRNSLKNYYEDNPEQTLFIKLYRGSYVPHFIDQNGQEQVQLIKQPTPTSPSSNDAVARSYASNDELYIRTPHSRPSPSVQSTAHAMSQSPSRVNLWLSGGEKKTVGS